MSRHQELVCDIKKKLEELINEKRYKHSIGVSETAIALAKIYHVDEKKAEIAGLLHDISKQFTVQEMKNFVKKNQLVDENSSDVVLHGLAGAIYSRNVFKISDSDILNAIRYHTIGRRAMSDLEKIIYIADAIEPNRDYPGVEQLRKEAFNNIDNAMLLEADRKIVMLIKKGKKIHLSTVEMRNWLSDKVKKYN